MWTAITEFFKTPQGIAILASACVLLINFILKKKPEKKSIIERFIGTIITAVKAAEKAIPDDTKNAGLARFDRAFKYIISVFAQVEGRLPTPDEELEIKEAIPVVHADIEADGGLEKE